MKSEATSELYLFLTPHIISSDEDIDKLRDAVKDGTVLLKDTNIESHIMPRGDTLPPAKLIKPDTTKKSDSLTTIRRRTPPRDTIPQVQPIDTLLPSRQWR